MSGRKGPTLRSPDAVELLLRQALWRALSGSLITSVGLSTGCVFDDDPFGPAPGMPISCPEGESFPVRTAGLTPAETHDYLAIRTRTGVPGEEGSGAGWTVPLSEVTELGETGTPCATATDEVCEELVGRHEAPFYPTSCVQLCEELSVVTTRADEVRRWVRPAELRALVGTVDSVDDALLLVRAAGYAITCNDATSTTVQEADDGYVVYVNRVLYGCTEPTVVKRLKLFISREGAISEKVVDELTRNDNICPGRKPQGLRSVSVPRGQNKLGDFLARCAHLEAASVFSFSRLVRELDAHGAPQELSARAHEARADEARHAAVMGALARAHGGELTSVVVDSLHVRSLEEMARENAVEGCVREAWAALVAAHQAERAEEPELRRAMLAIATDEARHASLAFAVQAWLDARLSAESRKRVRLAQTQAIFELVQALRAPFDPEIERTAGLPPLRVARRMLTALIETLWGASVVAPSVDAHRQAG